ncbi:MAG TPA: hypothetical protein VFM88_09980 [Vicinamibacteria bacterium]|nr:hypothetical protein [Vicinamibacteria bacterium]
MRRLLPNLALGAGAAVALGILLELFLRLFAPQVPPQAGLFRPDETVGFRQVAFFRGRFPSAEHAASVQTNSLGFRDREYPADKGGSFRILGLGDSFAFGVGVEEPMAYLARVEEALRPERVEVINAGLVGAGPDTEARLLEDVGPRLRPDLVVLGLFVGNDMRDAMLGPEAIEVREGSLAWRPGAQQRWDSVVTGGRLERLARASGAEVAFQDFLRAHSHAFRLVARGYAALRSRLASGGGKAPLGVFREEAFCLKSYPPEIEQGWRRTREALDRIKSWSERHGARLLLLLIPFRGQVEPQEWQEFLRTHDVREEDLDLEKPQDLVKRWADSEGVQALDLLPALRRAREEGGEVYYRRDPHWTARGHAVAAEQILAELRSSGLLPGRLRPSGVTP